MLTAMRCSTTLVRVWMLSLCCVMLLGCTNNSAPPTTANNFRPVDESASKKEKSGDAKTEPAENNADPNSKLATKKPAGDENAAPPEENMQEGANGKKEIVGPYAVKLNQLRKMGQFQPRGTTQAQQIESLVNNTRSQIEFAKELANDAAAPEEVRHEALFTCMKGYSMLMEAQEPEARENFEAIAKQMSEMKNEDIAAVGKAQLFSLKMIEVLSLKPEDGKPIVAAIEQVLESLGQHRVGFDATVRVAQVMDQLGLSDDASRAMEVISKHYSANPDPNVSMQAHGLEVSLLLKNLRTAKDDVAAELHKKLLGKLEQLAKISPNEEDISSLMQQVGRMFEGEGNGSAALPIYELAEKIYGVSKDDKLAEKTKSSVENAKKRIGLVGKPYEVSGVMTDGSPFDWATYKGKVVLIDFWATWCGPCLQEMSNIRKYYDQYHDQGFEVVGVNLDDEKEDLENFFSKQTLPWPSVVSDKAKELGFQNPHAVACGVDAIPFVMLIDRDGKVLGIHVRGERLGEELAKLFKAPAEKPEEKSSEQSAAKSVEKAVPAEKTEPAAEAK
jgi:thiol-disulfide isomerase/thioredoxin